MTNHMVSRAHADTETSCTSVAYTEATSTCQSATGQWWDFSHRQHNQCNNLVSMRASEAHAVGATGE